MSYCIDLLLAYVPICLLYSFVYLSVHQSHGSIYKQGDTRADYNQGHYGLLAFGLLGLTFLSFSPISLTFSTIDSGDTWRK